MSYYALVRSGQCCRRNSSITRLMLRQATRQQATGATRLCCRPPRQGFPCAADCLCCCLLCHEASPLLSPLPSSYLSFSLLAVPPSPPPVLQSVPLRCGRHSAADTLFGSIRLRAARTHSRRAAECTQRAGRQVKLLHNGYAQGSFQRDIW